MAKISEKHSALILRKNGLSINAIANKLHVSKSTVSMWCRDIILTEKQIQKIALQSKHHATAGLLRAAETLRSRRLLRTREAEDEGKRDVGVLNKRDIHMIGLGLYWGEGYKRGSQELGFTNSDPLLIQFYIKWLEKVFGISKEKLILRVSINNTHEHRDVEIIKFWSNITGIPRTQFTRTSFIKAASRRKYPQENVHYGTLRIKVRNGTQLRRRILGSIAAFQ